MTTCLITFPESTPLNRPCPRCGGNAGSHPAPLRLAERVMRKVDPTIFERPTLRQALAPARCYTPRCKREAVHAVGAYDSVTKSCWGWCDKHEKHTVR
jgi:hypothetical protein